VADDDDAPFKKPSKRVSRDDDEDEARPSKRRSRDEDDDDDDYDRRPRRRKPQGTKGMGIASMVCGIIGIVLSCCCLSIALNIVAIVLGMLSLKTAGRGMGMAGLICGILGLLLSLGWIVFRIAFGAANGGFRGAGGFNNF
jgi:hypothetical protein